MSYKVFLVEDEPLIRENIRNAIEKGSEPFECCGEAGDGELALSIIQDLKPDILITDIKMPFMDGLELARHAKAIIPWLRIIIISGYDEFELAREAISIGVDQYLLKPVASKDLFAALRKAGEGIEEHKRNSDSFLKEFTDEQIVRSALIGSLLERICSGELTANEALKRADDLGIALLAKRYVVLFCRYEFKKDSPNRQLIASRVKFALGEDAGALFFFSGIEHVVLLIKGDTDLDVTETAYHTAQTLKHEMEIDGNSALTISISGVVNRIIGIKDAYHEAGILMKTFGQVRRGRVFCPADIGQIDRSVSSSSENFCHMNIENKLKFAMKEDIPSIVEEITRNLDKNEMQNLLYRYYVLMDLTNTAMRIIQKFNPEADLRPITKYFVDMREVFQSSMSPEIFADMATEICTKMIELRDSGSSGHHMKLVQCACDYIHKNFNNPDISLNTVASAVSLSPTHFSTIFSQEMGVTFIEYLTDVRIEKAKELLVSTDEKLVNIAFAVGYNEPNYLSYLFKKREGITPKEFRSQRRSVSG